MRLKEVLFAADMNSDGTGLPATQLFSMRLTENSVTGKVAQESLQYLGERASEAPSFGATTVSGNIGLPISESFAPLFARHLIGAITKTAGTATLWTTGVAVTVGTIVNHSDGLHSLYCVQAGTTDATEPDLSAYTTRDMGRDVIVTDNTAKWKVYPKLYKYTATEGDCLMPFVLQNRISDPCAVGTDIVEKFGGCVANSVAVGFTGSDITLLKASIPVSGAIFTKSSDIGFVNLETSTGLTATDLVAEPFGKKGLTLTFNGTTTTSIQTTDFTLTIDNGVSSDLTLGTDTARVSTGSLQITGNMSAFVTPTLYADINNNAIQSVVADMKMSNAPFYMKFTFPKITPTTDGLVHATDKATKINAMLTASQGDLTGGIRKSVQVEILSSTDIL